MQIYPMSYAQQHIWAAMQNGFEPIWQHINRGFAIEATPDWARLRGALDDLTQRHPIIAGRVVSAEGSARLARKPGQQPEECLTVLPGVWERKAAEEEVLSTINRQFDLDSEPPLRVIAAACADGTYMIHFVAHHLCLDVRALGIVLADFAKYYFSPESAAGQLEDPPPSFFDYIEQETEYRASAGFAERLDHWRRELSGASGEMSFAGKAPDPPASQRKIIPLEIEGDLLAGIKQLAARHRITVFAVLACGIQRTLRDSLGLEDTVLQVVADGRRGPFTGTAGQFGDFIFLRQPQVAASLGDEHLRATASKLLRGLSSYIPYFALLDELPWFRSRVTERPFAYTGSEVMVRYLAGPDAVAAFRASAPGTAIAGVHLQAPPHDPPGYDGVLLQYDFAVLRERIRCFFGYEPEVIPDRLAAELGQRLLSALAEAGSRALRSWRKYAIW